MHVQAILNIIAGIVWHLGFLELNALYVAMDMDPHFGGYLLPLFGIVGLVAWFMKGKSHQVVKA
jgi:hypothetical protein